ncbi:MAG: hypothetical protein V4608_07265 [Bacteroidota bacterium]
MKSAIIFIFLTCFTFASYQSKSQGCSDAGTCSLGSLSVLSFKFEYLPSDKKTLSTIEIEDPQLVLKTTGLKKDKITSDTSVNNKYLKYTFQFTTYYGLGEQSTSIYTGQLEGNVSIIKQKLYAQLKLPYTFINGNLGSVNGMGDVTIGLSYVAFNKKTNNLSVSGGVKLPSNKADTHKSNLPLPMVYQTSLGSTDVLVGAKYVYKKWDFTAGYQHSFNATQNSYLNNSLNSDSVIYNSYFQSNKMKRADDGLFRINRNFRLKNISTNAGVLIIYHLANDKITDAFGNRVSADGSQGLTVNLNFSGILPLSEKSDFIFIVGAPVLTRTYGTDGLLRKFVCIVGVRFNMYKTNL